MTLFENLVGALPGNAAFAPDATHLLVDRIEVRNSFRTFYWPNPEAICPAGYLDFSAHARCNTQHTGGKTLSVTPVRDETAVGHLWLKREDRDDEFSPMPFAGACLSSSSRWNAFLGNNVSRDMRVLEHSRGTFYQ